MDSVSRPSPDGAVGLSRIVGTDLGLPPRRPFPCTPSRMTLYVYSASAEYEGEGFIKCRAIYRGDRGFSYGPVNTKFISR